MTKLTPPFFRKAAALIQEIGVTRAADCLAVTRQQLYKILSGKNSVSADMALRFESAFGLDASLMLQQQATFQLKQARKKGVSGVSRVVLSAFFLFCLFLPSFAEAKSRAEIGFWGWNLNLSIWDIPDMLFGPSRDHFEGEKASPHLPYSDDPLTQQRLIFEPEKRDLSEASELVAEKRKEKNKYR